MKMINLVKAIAYTSLLVLTVAYILTYSMSFSAIFLIGCGAGISFLSGGQPKAIASKWEGKMIVARQKKQRVDSYLKGMYEDLWAEGIRDSDVKKKLNKYSPEYLKKKIK